jgi:RNA polymerase sigma-70 factor (sigma-E family)
MGTSMAGVQSSPGADDFVLMSAGADVGVERLFREHRLTMVRLAALLVDDRESAEDIVQEAFAALHRHWTTLSPDGSPLAYLRVCVVNGARSALRRRRTARLFALRTDPPLPTAAADQGVLLAEDERQVIAALQRLPQRQREVIVLRYWSELTEPQIAKLLHISVGSVKSAASRGRAAIAAHLEGLSDGRD